MRFVPGIKALQSILCRRPAGSTFQHLLKFYTRQI